MTYAQKVATGLIASMPTLCISKTDQAGKEHKWEIQSAFELNECYIELSALGLLEHSFLCFIAKQYEEMMTNWKATIS